MIDRQLAYVERLPHGIEIGTRHDPKCSQPWDVPQPDAEISEHSLEAVEEACNVATIAIEHRYPWWLRALWYVERSVWCRTWLRRLRLFRRRPYQFKDPITHRGDEACCRWLCLVTVHDASDVPTGAIAAEKYLYDRGYEIVPKF
jgi:hypothetical protein